MSASIHQYAEPPSLPSTTSYLASRHQVPGEKHVVLVALNRELVRSRVAVLHQSVNVDVQQRVPSPELLPYRAAPGRESPTSHGG